MDPLLFPGVRGTWHRAQGTCIWQVLYVQGVQVFHYHNFGGWPNSKFSSKLFNTSCEAGAVLKTALTLVQSLTSAIPPKIFETLPVLSFLNWETWTLTDFYFLLKILIPKKYLAFLYLYRCYVGTNGWCYHWATPSSILFTWLLKDPDEPSIKRCAAHRKCKLIEDFQWKQYENTIIWIELLYVECSPTYPEQWSRESGWSRRLNSTRFTVKCWASLLSNIV